MYAHPFMAGLAGAQDPLAEIRYGLRSPNFATRVQAVKDFGALLPAVLVEENAFLYALNDAEDLTLTSEQDVLAQAVKDAVAYLNLAISDVYCTRNVERMAQIAYFFNLLGKVVEKDDVMAERDELSAEIDDLKEMYAASQQEVYVSQANVAFLERRLEEEREKREQAVENFNALKAKHGEDIEEWGWKTSEADRLAEESKSRDELYKNEVAALRKEIEECKLRDSESKKMIDELVKAVSEAEDERLKSERVSAEHVLIGEELQAEIDFLHEQLDAKESIEVELTRCHNLLDEKDSTNEDLFRQRLDLQIQLRDHEQKADEQIEEQTRVAYDLRQRMAELEEENKEMNYQRQKDAFKYALLVSQNAALEDLNAKLRKASKSSKNLIERPKTTTEALTLLNAVLKETGGKK